jgi:hypothetical protein
MGARRRLAGPAAVSIVAAAALAGAPSAAADGHVGCIECEPFTGQVNALQKITANPGQGLEAFDKFSQSPAFEKVTEAFGKHELGPIGPFWKYGR